MALEHEIDYGALIDHSIRDFQPAKRLWPAGARLLCWILLDAAILGLAVWVRGYDNLQALLQNSGQLFAAGLFIFAGIITAFLALKSAVPGRQVTWPQLVMALAVVGAAFSFEAQTGEPFQGFLEGVPILAPQLFGLAALPWLALFWAVRRGIPLRPEMTGVAVGLAAFCCAMALRDLVSPPDLANPVIAAAFSGILITAFSAAAGTLWLNWIEHWHQERVAAEVPATKWSLFNAGTILPAALSASIIALIFVLKGPSQHSAQVPDFDLAIGSYERALVGFRPNVPSTSMETMLTAYVEHGMPAYMWDFGPEGFKLVGGRWDPLADGTPVTFTWFRGRKAGVLCMFRQIDAFNPPSIAHEEHHHLLFYKYRGFSVCLINVGGYGNFISVIAAPMPMKQFMRLVLAAAI